MSNGSTFKDSASVYGWTSILLHWLTAAIIITLWFLGKSISSVGSDAVDARRALHVSIAASAWLLLLIRIIWRLRSGHPRVRGQSNVIHHIAATTHYAMLALLVVMLLSGPFLVWSRGHAVSLFALMSIPSPVAESETLHDIAWSLHSSAALVLLILILFHLGGALKHLMFHSDDTIVRMLWPGCSRDTT